MDEKFVAIVNSEFEFSVDMNALSSLDVITDAEVSHIISNQKSIEVRTLHADFQKKTYTISLNGNQYQVKIETPLDKLIADMGLSLGTDSIENHIQAPMPGIILEVNVSEGQEVKKGDFLCVLEAMKMENTLTAPRDGIVKAVNIAKGETVDKGKLLIELERND